VADVFKEIAKKIDIGHVYRRITKTVNIQQPLVALYRFPRWEAIFFTDFPRRTRFRLIGTHPYQIPPGYKMAGCGPLANVLNQDIPTNY